MAIERFLPAEPWLRQSEMTLMARSLRMGDGVLDMARSFLRSLECGPIPPPSVRVTIQGHCVLRWDNARGQKLAIIVPGGDECLYRYLIEGPGVSDDFKPGLQVVAVPNVEIGRRLIAEIHPVYIADVSVILHEQEKGVVPREYPRLGDG